MIRIGIHGGLARKRPRRRPVVLMAAAVAACSLLASTGAAAAATTKPGTTHAATSTSAGTSTGTASSAGTVKPSLARKPFTGTGCHTYNYWNGAHVCITVNGGGLNVQSVTGETDGPDSDWGELYDTAGVISIWGHPTNHYLSVSWASGGGVWLANGDNFCFADTTLGQTACLTVHA